MRTRWSSTDPDAVPVGEGLSQDLIECARASRLLGSDSYLVLHGGGNSSVKIGQAIYVKASGFDMRTIGPEGFSGLDRAALDTLLARDTMTDADLVSGLRAALLDPVSATPSIETLLHNLLPFRSVLHSHADPIVTLTDNTDAHALVAEVFGEDVLLLPYCMPGFELAKLVQNEWAKLEGREVRGIVLAHHGLFTFGDTAQQAYERQIDLIERAERFILQRTGIEFVDDPEEAELSWKDAPVGLRSLAVRGSELAGTPLIACALVSPTIAAFVRRADVTDITQRGPSTLEHVIRTKRVPQVGADVDGYAQAYAEYFLRNQSRSATPLTMLDPAPRVILDPVLGIVSLGRTDKDARIVQDIYRHTIRVIAAAEALSTYLAITEGQSFDIEYWDLEQAKLHRA
ncbi:class II aldolase/adducin family protein [Pengzhenrongella frigida]|uniref:Class II aldolase/adducin N-terminal domain-containing protein n=1 Tax=Pengzhenrongella frigida TaxID=1259133 RepID=A0A4Q5MW63_9MICO|nr:class II aldolase/adducin family protein [Cellulomonas sp. HLT2-17]RYV49779.1 hypothetical protein EUA98_16995 [Cellulomonas sp. HLT2-17]